MLADGRAVALGNGTAGQEAGGAVGVPHSAQNFEVAPRLALQLVQCFCVGVPHSAQNLAPTGSWLSQFAQLIVAVCAARLLRRRGLRRRLRSRWLLGVALAAAREARRRRRRRRALGRGRRGLHHLVGDAHAGAEEDRAHRAAALGHALARALERLGLGRLEEPAGQPAVGRVAGQLLQPRVVVVIQVDVEVAQASDGRARSRPARGWPPAWPRPRSPGCAWTAPGSARHRT